MTEENKDEIIFGADEVTNDFNFVLEDEPKAETKDDKDEVVFDTKTEDALTDVFGNGSEDDEDIFSTDEVKKEETKAEDVLDPLADKEELKEEEGADYKDMVLAFIESGEWDFDAIEDEEGNVIKLSEMEIDEDTFERLKQHNKEVVKEKAKEELLGEMSEAEKEFIEFKKTGGDLDKYVASYKIKQAAATIDISTDNGKVNAVRAYWQNIKKKSPEWTEKHIKRIIADMDLDEEANTAKTEIQEFTERQHANIVAAQKEEEAERAQIDAEARAKYEEEVNTYKSNMESKLKESGVNGKKVSSILKSFVERDDKGLTELDKLYLTMKKNPEQALFLYEALTNPTELSKAEVKKQVAKKELSTFKTLKFKKTTKNNNTVKEKEGNDEVLFTV